MKIKRGDTVIELTESEMEEIFFAQRIKNCAEDIKSFFEEFGENCPFSDEKLNELAESIDSIVYSDSDYVDTYNTVKRQVVEEALEEMEYVTLDLLDLEDY